MLFFLNRLAILLILFISLTDIYAQNPGDVLWTKHYGGDSYDEANAVIKAHDSGYIFVGYTQSYGLDRWGNAFIGKTLPNGDSLFTFHFGGPGNDVLTDVIPTSDGNYAAVGFSDSDVDFEQLYIVKFNDSGDTLWTKTYGGSIKEIGFSILETEDNGFMIAGLTSSTGAGNEDIWLLRTNSTGDTLWTKTHGTAGNDMAHGMCATSDGNYAITGLMNDAALMIMKFDTNGSSLWTLALGGSGYEEGISIIESDNSDLMVLGHTSSSGAGELDVYLVKVTSDGVLVYEKTYGSSTYDEGRDILQIKPDEFIIAGNTGAGEMDYYIISVNGMGEENWSKIIGTNGPERCYDLMDNKDGNFLIAGSNSAGGGLEDAALTLMFGDSQTDVNDDNLHAASYVLYDAYPNPFNPSTVIRFSIPESGIVNLKIYDALGKEIMTPINGYKSAGEYSFRLNTSEYKLSSGVYFYTLSAGDFTSTKKMVLTK